MPVVTQITQPDLQRPREWFPAHALVFYQKDSESMCLAHPVLTTYAKPELGAARPLSHEQKAAIIQSLGVRSFTATRENTLAVSANGSAWWRPPATAPLRFAAKYQGTEAISCLNDIPVPLPGLVFIATHGRLSVYAVQGGTRPTPETMLCHAPFWNIFGNAQVCQGTTIYPKEITPDAQEAWEAAFFGSYFTGPSRSDRYLAWERSYQELLEKAIADGAFPQDVLLPSKTTLQQALE